MMLTEAEKTQLLGLTEKLKQILQDINFALTVCEKDDLTYGKVADYYTALQCVKQVLETPIGLGILDEINNA